MKFNVSDVDKHKTGVYQIRNTINSNIYIGSTTQNFQIRYYKHLSDYKRTVRKTRLLHKAFEEYDIQNFEFTILEICSKEDCLQIEQVYLNKGTNYNSAPNSNNLLGVKHPPDSKTRTIIGGLHHTSKEIYQFDINGVFIKKHTSLIEALKLLGKTKNGTSHLTQCCLGKTYSAFGYKWSFTNNLIKRIDKRTLPISQIKRIKMSKPRNKELHDKIILCINLTTQQNIKFPSIRSAAEYYQILTTSIYNNLKGLSKIVKYQTNKLKFSWE